MNYENLFWYIFDKGYEGRKQLETIMHEHSVDFTEDDDLGLTLTEEEYKLITEEFSRVVELN